MNETPATAPVLRPLISEEQMGRILSSRRSVTSEEFLKQVENHLGRRLLPGRRKIFVDGQPVWVSC
jgi:hypothetical protein